MFEKAEVTKKKSANMAGLLWGATWVSGISWHRFYLQKWASGIAQTLCFWLGLPLCLVVIGVVPVLAGLAWVVADFFLLKSMVKSYNAM